MRLAAARYLVFLVVSMALVGLGTPARAQYLCRMMGYVGSTCCCPAAAKASRSERETVIRSTGCCERIAAAGYAPAAPPRDVTGSVPQAALAAMLPSSVYEVGEAELSVVLPALARAPPVEGAPLFIVHCALLI
jgi:hypothetical protein